MDFNQHVLPPDLHEKSLHRVHRSQLPSPGFGFHNCFWAHLQLPRKYGNWYVPFSAEAYGWSKLKNMAINNVYPHHPEHHSISITSRDSKEFSFIKTNWGLGWLGFQRADGLLWGLGNGLEDSRVNSLSARLIFLIGYNEIKVLWWGRCDISSIHSRNFYRLR